MARERFARFDQELTSASTRMQMGGRSTSHLTLEPESSMTTLLAASGPVITVFDVGLSLDESAGLQNFATSSGVIGDSDDNDISAASLPAVFSAYLSAMGAGTPINAALSGYDGSAGNTGANVFSVSSTGTITDLSLTDSQGDPLVGLDSGLMTTDGRKIFLYTDSSNNNIVLGRLGFEGATEAPGDDLANPDGAIVFALYLEETGTPVSGGKIWSVLYQSLWHGDATNPDDAVNLADKVYITADQAREFSLQNAPAGQNLFMMFGDTQSAIVVTGRHPANQSAGESITTGDTVNTSGATNTTIGTNNQMIDPPSYDKAGVMTKVAEGMYFTFVTGANANYTVPNLDQNEADIEANIQFSGLLESAAASFKIAQTDPSSKAATLKISAYTTELETGVNFIDGLGDADDAKVTITQVVVKNAAGTVLESEILGVAGAVNSANLDIRFANGSATVEGVKAGYVVEYYTNGDHARVLIENVGAGFKGSANYNAGFDIGGFTLLEATQTTAEVGSHVYFEDDGPGNAIEPSDVPGGLLEVDETFLGTQATVSFATFFENFPSPGQDGAQPVSSTFELAVSVQGVDSGLVDTATDLPVNLFLIDGVVVGSIATDVGAVTTENTVFTLTLDLDDATATLTQMRAIVHPDGSDPNDGKTLVLPDLIAITRTDTIVDGDGDTYTTSATIYNAQALTFYDDGPSATVALTGSTVTVDETADADDVPGALGQASAMVVSSAGSAYGADEEGGTTVFSLSIAADGTDSGLKTTGETPILLYDNGGTIEGRVGGAAGAVAFDFTIAGDGTVTLTQYLSLWHADATDHDDPMQLAAGTIAAVVTVTDGDDDVASDSVDISGQFVFEDDGPSATVALTGNTVTVDETADADDVPGALGQASAMVAISAGSAYGADEEGGTTVFSLSIAAEGTDSGLKTTDETPILLYDNGGTIEGRVGGAAGAVAFDFTIAGDGTVTLTQYLSLWHADASDHDDPMQLTAGTIAAVVTVTDGDDDVASDSVDISGQFVFEDDGPSATVALTGNTVTVDETADADDVPGALGQASAMVVSSAGSAYGADEEGGTTVFSLSIAVEGTDSGLKTTDETPIYLYDASGTIEGRVGGAAGAVAFDFTIDSGSGVVTLTQYLSLWHADASDHDDPMQLTAGTIAAVVTVTDGDDDVASDSVDISGQFVFEDDGPSATVALTGNTVTVDETADADDVPGALGQASAMVVSSAGSAYGADEEGGTTVFSLSIAAEGTDSGLKTTDETPIYLYDASGTIEGRVGGAAGPVAFDFTIAANGTVTLTQYLSLWHADASDHDDPMQLAAGTIAAVVTVTDGDDDVASDSVDISGQFVFEDDGPTVNAKSNVIYANTGNPMPGGTGVFDYAIGADVRSSYSATNSDFSPVSLSGTVGMSEIANATVTWFAEDATSAVFSITFDYLPNPSDPGTFATATGTLSFDKVAGTYNVSLDEPIEGYTIVRTGQSGAVFVGYEPEDGNPATPPVIDKTQPAVSVAELAEDFFVQFTGYSEPGGGTGTNNLKAGPGATAGDNAFVDGELFYQASAWVSTSGSANGVAGDTMQTGEVLDMDFFVDSPYGDTAKIPDAGAAGIFLRFDGIGASEDLVVVLKLVDPMTGTHTTRALIIDNADIYKGPSTTSMVAGYDIGVALDNNDGVVFIESNDYNVKAGDNWVIEGAQVLGSTEGITGSGIDLVGATGDGGGSSATLRAFNTDPAVANSTTESSSEPIKISDIGFVLATSGNLNAELKFDFAVIDGDGDATAIQSVTVGIVNDGTYAGQAALADVFDINRLADAPAGDGRAVITNFEAGLDIIDLSDVDAITGGGDDMFSYVGSDPFSGAAGQLRYDAGNGWLEGDLNGDLVADLQIVIGSTAPMGGDLIL